MLCEYSVEVTSSHKCAAIAGVVHTLSPYRCRTRSGIQRALDLFRPQHHLVAPRRVCVRGEDDGIASTYPQRPFFLVLHTRTHTLLSQFCATLDVGREFGPLSISTPTGRCFYFASCVSVGLLLQRFRNRFSTSLSHSHCSICLRL